MEEHSRASQEPWSLRVVDTSIMLKWFLVGTDSDKALALLIEHKRKESLIVIPTLAIYEFISQIQQTYSSYSLERIRSWIRQIYNLNLKFILPLQPQVEQTIELALQTRALTSASIYAFIARKIGAELITADTTPYQSLQTYARIISLSEI